MGKTEINAQITIETNVIQSITLPIKAFLTKPTIVSDEVIDFDVVQVGAVQSRNIRIFNPSEDTLMI